MRYNKLGNTDLVLSEIGFGAWQISGDVWGKKNDTQSLRAIHTALEGGINFIDTASVYGGGHSEKLVGQALRQARQHEVVLSTKVIPKCRKWTPSPEADINDYFPKQWIIEQCEESLTRLQVETIGILFLHTWSSAWGHHTEWFEAMQLLKKQGKIQAIGISIPDERIADANVHIEAGRVDVIQSVYNIFQQEPEYTLFPLTQKHHVGIIARTPFSSGALIGNWHKDMRFEEDDWRGTWPQTFKKNWLEEQVDMADAVKTVITTENRTMANAAIKFILMNRNVTAAIPGSSNPNHVLSNVAAAKSPPLSTNTMQQLKQLWLAGKIHGTYNGSI